MIRPQDFYIQIEFTVEPEKFDVETLKALTFVCKRFKILLKYVRTRFFCLKMECNFYLITWSKALHPLLYIPARNFTPK